LGGGPVAVEMATVWSSLGSQEISLIERGERILSRYEPFVGERLAQIFRKKDISILTGTKIKLVRRISGREEEHVEITLDNGSKIIGDEILVATGRKPNTEDIGLETVSAASGGWLDVDDTCLVKGVDGG
jgi:pyruvate/2-oxoglutarate dehydrogenase complex dihydrolipoamide dehydrogenase (E3) component